MVDKPPVTIGVYNTEFSADLYFIQNGVEIRHDELASDSYYNRPRAVPNNDGSVWIEGQYSYPDVRVVLATRTPAGELKFSFHNRPKELRPFRVSKTSVTSRVLRDRKHCVNHSEFGAGTKWERCATNAEISTDENYTTVLLRHQLFAVPAGRIFVQLMSDGSGLVMSYDDQELSNCDSRCVVELDPATGALLHATEVFPKSANSFETIVAVLKNRQYLIAADHTFFLLNENGTPLWTHPINNLVNSPYSLQDGYWAMNGKDVLVAVSNASGANLFRWSLTAAR